MSSCFSFSFAILNFGIKRTQNMYGIVVETLRLSLIYQTCFDGISVFVSEIESLKLPLNLIARDVTKFVALRDNIYKFNSLNKYDYLIRRFVV